MNAPQAERVLARFGRDPRFDWEVVLLFFLALNIISATAGFFVYERINAGEIFLVEKADTAPKNVMDTFELEKTVSFFENKRERFEILRKTPLRTADPYTIPPAKKK